MAPRLTQPSYSSVQPLNPNRARSSDACFIIFWPSLQGKEYRKLAKVQNDRSNAVQQYKCSIYEFLKGLLMKRDALLAEAMKKSPTEIYGVYGTHKNMACRYNGGWQGMSTTIYWFCYSSWTCGNYTFRAGTSILINSKSEEDEIAREDWCLFKRFVYSYVLFSSQDVNVNFSRWLGRWIGRYNPLCRAEMGIRQLSFLSSKNNSRSVQHFILVLKKKQIFLTVINMNVYRQYMEMAKIHCLITTLSDIE